MALIVQKYGGSSVGSTGRIKSVSQRIYRTVKEEIKLLLLFPLWGKPPTDWSN